MTLLPMRDGSNPDTGLPPMQQDAPQHGFAGFIERMLNPTNTIGKFGQALLAAGGDLSGATRIMMQLNQKNAAPDEEFAQWQRQYDYQGAHPHTAATADEFTRHMDLAGITDPEQRKALYLQHVQRMGDPNVTLTLPGDRGIYSGPQSGLAGALGGMSAPGAMAPKPPAPGMGEIVDDPRIAGGGTPSGAGPFLGR